LLAVLPMRIQRPNLLLVVMLVTLAGLDGTAHAQAGKFALHPELSSPRTPLRLEKQASPKWRRRGHSLLGSGLGTGLGFASAYLAGHMAGSKCRARSLPDAEDPGNSCEMHSVFAGFLMFLFTAPALTSIGADVTHRALGGKGRWWKGVLGTFLGGAIGSAALVGATVGDESRASLIAAISVAGLAMATMPVVLLETDHATRERPSLSKGPTATRSARAHSSAPRLRASALPVAGGLIVGIGGRL
jgi:hypothetical protein